MGFWSSLIWSGLGFVLGGPIGAIIGGIIGSSVSTTKKLEEETSSRRYRHNRRTTNENDYKICILVLLTCIMKADGKMLRSELNIIKSVLIQLFGEEGALEALQIIKNLTKKDLNEIEIAQQIKNNLNYSARLELIHILIEIAYADGEYSVSEQQMIERIVVVFGISMVDYQSLCAPYNKQKNHNWAYDVLEIEPTASNDEVKKAYRRMAMKFHPDKVATAGEDVKKKATEKFRTINEAYESIKTERGNF